MKSRGLGDDIEKFTKFTGIKKAVDIVADKFNKDCCLLYTSPSPRDYAASRMPSSA